MERIRFVSIVGRVVGQSHERVKSHRARGGLVALAGLLGVVAPTLIAPAVPAGAAVSPLAFVAEPNSAAVGVANTATDTAAGTVPVGTDPDGLAASKDGSRVYVANFDSNTVSVIDTTTLKVVATVPTEEPTYIAVSPKGSRAYVCNQGLGTISVINTKTDKVVGTYHVPGTPEGIAVSHNGETLWVADDFASEVSVLSASSGAVLTNIVLTTPVVAPLALSPNGELVYAVEPNVEKVAVIDTTTESLVTEVKVAGADYLAFEPNGSSAYVTSGGANVSVISTATSAVTATFTVAGGAIGIAFTPDSKHALISGGVSLSVVKTATNTVTKTINMGSATVQLIIVTPPA